MLFNSYSFILFLLVTFGLYYLPALQAWQKAVLVVASLFFYAVEQPVLLILLLSSIVINTLASYQVCYGRPALRRPTAAAAVGADLAILAFFKYSPLVGRTLFSPTNSLGEFLVALPLPIGISFFTFHGISLLVDTLRSDRIEEYRGLIPRSLATHAINTSLFITLFPQLVAGPIVKAHELLPQIAPKLRKAIDWTWCFKHLTVGYFLKMVVADNLKDHTFWIAFPYFQFKSSVTLLAMLCSFSMQIFADFAGYSLIAMGLAGLFGYRLPVNFNFPYISQSFAEFWRRWHISLSSFLREYLYFPLGGNRRGPLRTYWNLIVVMFLGGLWHGAAWSFAVWGLAHGVALAAERFIGSRLRLPAGGVVRAARALGVFGFVTLAWLLFKLPDFRHAAQYVGAMFSNTSVPTSATDVRLMLLYSAPVVAYHGWYLLRERAARALRVIEPCLYGAMLFLILTNSGASRAFIYFQF